MTQVKDRAIPFWRRMRKNTGPNTGEEVKGPRTVSRVKVLEVILGRLSLFVMQDPCQHISLHCGLFELFWDLFLGVVSAPPPWRPSAARRGPRPHPRHRESTTNCSRSSHTTKNNPPLSLHDQLGWHGVARPRAWPRPRAIIGPRPPWPALGDRTMYPYRSSDDH